MRVTAHILAVQARSPPVARDRRQVLSSQWSHMSAMVFGKDSMFNISNAYVGALQYGHCRAQRCRPRASTRCPLPGFAYYTLALLYPTLRSLPGMPATFFGVSVLASLASAYLASILVFVLHDFCMVCVGTYVVNMVILLFSYGDYRRVRDRMAKAA